MTPTVASRLDRLPFTRLHGKLLAASGLGWAMDAMDVGLVSFILVALPASWGVGVTEKSWLASAGFAGMAIGASLGGLLADRLGRRQVFAGTLLIYGLATGASALAWSMAALIALRFFVGLGLGAELPVASTLVSELSPTRIRGRVIVWLEAFWAVGWTLAAVIGYTVADPSGPFGGSGWRLALAVGALPALYAVVVRRGLPESARFLESRGRQSEAEAVVAAFERSAAAVVRPSSSAVGRAGAAAAPPTAVAVATPPEAVAARPAAEEAAAETAGPGAGAMGSAGGATGSGAGGPGAASRSAATPVTALFKSGLARRTVAIWTIWFCVNFAYYGAFTWLPTILAGDLGSVTRSLQYTLIITLAQLPGYAVAAFLVEVWGRRLTLATFLIGSALAAALFSQAGSPGQIIAAGMLLSFFNLGAWGALYASTPELYPTAFRGTGTGWAAGVGRLASIAAPLIAPLVFTRSTAAAFVLFAVVFAIAAVAAFALPEMKGRPLRD
ncbi:MAG: MFS transporter [Propionibacteriaceae bacterium]|jgi:putative MFS transporter|nr:MFS transporter [Propionibacteriaceae bacterium]